MSKQAKKQSYSVKNAKMSIYMLLLFFFFFFLLLLVKYLLLSALLSDWIDFVLLLFLCICTFVKRQFSQAKRNAKSKTDCYSNETHRKGTKQKDRNKKLTLISVLGWSMNTISDSSPSNKTLTVFSPNSSSVATAITT